MKLSAILFLLCLFSIAVPLMAQETNPNMLFDAIDTDGDRFISKKEFLGAKITIDRDKVILLFPNMTHANQLKEEELRARLFDHLDLNHDGLLSHDEVGRILPNIVQLRF